jgi:hypothetical protein
LAEGHELPIVGNLDGRQSSHLDLPQSGPDKDDANALTFE